MQNCKKRKLGLFTRILIIIFIIYIAASLIKHHLPGIIRNIGEMEDSSGIQPIYTNNEIKPFCHLGFPKSQNKIALIDIIGMISSEGNSWDDMANANEISDQLHIAAEDNSIKAVILYIDSPGGEITATDKIYHYVRKVREANKPVIAYMDSEAASGGYYVAVAADYIVANKLTMTGSIGVIINGLKFYDLMNKIGLQDEVFKSGKMKDLLNPARATTIEEKQLIDNMVMESYGQFVSVVSKGRIAKNKQLTEKYIRTSEVGDGRIFSGEQALKLGLVDKLGYFDDAIDKIFEMSGISRDDYQIIRFEEEYSLGDVLSRYIYSSLKIKLGIPGLERAAAIRPGKAYYLNPAFIN